MRFRNYKLFLLSVVLLSCSSTSVETKLVRDLHIEEQKAVEKTCYEISGLLFNSALSINNVSHYQNDDYLVVEVIASLDNKLGKGCNLKERICIDKPVKYIMFGKERKIIWRATD
jgi:hypothetical protein